MTYHPDFPTLSVGELKALLSRFPDNTPVAIAVRAGDYWHNTLAENVREAEITTVSYSEYHRAYKVPKEEEAPSDDHLKVLLLR